MLRGLPGNFPSLSGPHVPVPSYYIEYMACNDFYVKTKVHLKTIQLCWSEEPTKLSKLPLFLKVLPASELPVRKMGILYTLQNSKIQKVQYACKFHMITHRVTCIWILGIIVSIRITTMFIRPSIIQTSLWSLPFSIYFFLFLKSNHHLIS